MAMTLEGRLAEAGNFLLDCTLFRNHKRDMWRLVCAFRANLLLNQPAYFLSYWGVGAKTQTGQPEHDALQFQHEWQHQLQAILGLEICMEYIMTDTHAQINHVPDESAQTYMGEALQLLMTSGFRVFRMSELLLKSGVVGCEDGDPSLWDSVPQRLRNELEHRAHERCMGGDPIIAARRYFAQNLRESAALLALFPNRIFVTYQLATMDRMLPLLPCIHTYVGLNQNVRRPWFDPGQDLGDPKHVRT